MVMGLALGTLSIVGCLMNVFLAQQLVQKPVALVDAPKWLGMYFPSLLDGLESKLALLFWLEWVIIGRQVHV